MRIVIALAPTLFLAACGGGEGTEITLNVNDPQGAINASTSKDGTVAIKAPGFSGAIKLPKFTIDAGDFDLNGVKLPDGSKISSFNIDGDSGDKDRVRIAFTSPVGPGGVRSWFAERLPKAGFKVSLTDDGLTGTTDDGDPFTLKSKAAASGAESAIVIGG